MAFTQSEKESFRFLASNKIVCPRHEHPDTQPIKCPEKRVNNSSADPTRSLTHPHPCAQNCTLVPVTAHVTNFCYSKFDILCLANAYVPHSHTSVFCFPSTRLKETPVVMPACQNATFDTHCMRMTTVRLGMTEHKQRHPLSHVSSFQFSHTAPCGFWPLQFVPSSPPCAERPGSKKSMTPSSDDHFCRCAEQHHFACILHPSRHASPTQ
mmetsp:Transcript_79051/g.115832  ORF Transcript_79051/g.115832 Transcript_79051/m.115832 type:complete len:210 (-) Transcript_79051:485-1114(-)